MVMTMKTIDYTQFDFHDDIKKLVTDIGASKKRYDLIVGFSRGGLIPGVVLSHKMGVPFMAVNWSKTLQEVNDTVWSAVAHGKNVLVVDDMVDTGELLQQFFESVERWTATNLGVVDPTRIDLAVLINNVDVKQVYVNNLGTVQATFWGREISRVVTPAWITYWWEQ